MFHKTQSLIWSMKNAGFMERLFHFKLPLLGLLTNMHLWAKVGIVRRKGKDCIEDDILYTATLYNHCMAQRLYYQKLSQIMFVIASLSQEQTNQNHYQLIAQIPRNCVPYEKFINTSVDWDTVLRMLLNLELMEVSLTKNYYQSSETCTEPRFIGSGFGEHTINPVKCDEFNYPIIDESVMYISRVLNIIEKLYG